MLENIINISTKTEEGYIFRAKICANSKKNSYEFVDSDEYKLKLKISKPAVDGKANKEIISFISEMLNLPKNNIKIVKGEKSTIKAILIKI